jgi:enhancing lycopene biosynthesis protein 2
MGIWFTPNRKPQGRTEMDMPYVASLMEQLDNETLLVCPVNGCLVDEQNEKVDSDELEEKLNEMTEGIEKLRKLLKWCKTSPLL